MCRLNHENAFPTYEETQGYQSPPSNYEELIQQFSKILDDDPERRDALAVARTVVDVTAQLSIEEHEKLCKGFKEVFENTNPSAAKKYYQDIANISGSGSGSDSFLEKLPPKKKSWWERFKAWLSGLSRTVKHVCSAAIGAITAVAVLLISGGLTPAVISGCGVALCLSGVIELMRIRKSHKQ